MRFLDCVLQPSMAPRGPTSRYIATDKRVRAATWVLANVLVLVLSVSLWSLTMAPYSTSSAGLLVAALLLFNGAMLFRVTRRVGYPVANITGSTLVLRFIADSFAFGALKSIPSSPRFVEFDFSEIQEISGHEIEIIWPGRRRTRGHWVLLNLDQKTGVALSQAFGALPHYASRLWLLGPGQPGEIFMRWYGSFTPPISQWLSRLSQSLAGVDAQIRHATLDLTAFAGMHQTEQKAVIRKLNALNLKVAALLLVKGEKKLSVEQASLFVRDAVEYPSAER